MSEWKKYKLGDIVKFSSGGTPAKSNEAFWGGTIPWISASSMEGYTYSDSTLRITELGLKNGSRIAPENSLLLLVRGSILHQKLQVGIVERDVSFNQDVKCLQPNEEIIDSWFLLFWFKSEEKNLLKKVESTGIGAGKLDTPVLKDLLIKVPPPHERSKLNKIFKDLQTKIELNRQMNQTLEAMAQALFKSWFVDFDPVMDNALAAGNDIPEELQIMAEKRALVPHSKKLIAKSPELAKEFPSSFVYNETLRKWIPEGWEVKKIKDIGKVITGKTPSSNTPEHFGDVYPFVTPTDFKNYFKLVINSDRKLSQKGFDENIKRVLPEGSVIVTCIGSDMGKVVVAKTKCLTNQQINSVIPYYNLISSEFLFQFFNWNYDLLRTLAFGGSTMPILNKTDFENIFILIPPIEVMQSITNSLKEFDNIILNNLKQTETITEFRDSLLPHLISGKLRVENKFNNIINPRKYES